MSENDTEEKDDAAVGHGLRVLISDAFDKFKYVIVLALALGWGGREFAHTSTKPSAEVASITEVSHKLDKMAVVLVEVRVTNKAILNSLPKDQRLRAQSSIDNSLADLRLSREIQP